MINNPGSITAQIFDNCTHDEKELIANTAALIIKANSNRKYLALINNSNTEITLTLGELRKVANNKGIILKPGGSYEINSNNLYIGAVSAISKFACKISFTECI